MKIGQLVHHCLDNQDARVLRFGHIGPEWANLPGAYLQWLDDSGVPTGEQTWSALRNLTLITDNDAPGPDEPDA